MQRRLLAALLLSLFLLCAVSGAGAINTGGYSVIQPGETPQPSATPESETAPAASPEAEPDPVPVTPAPTASPLPTPSPAPTPAPTPVPLIPENRPDTLTITLTGRIGLGDGVRWTSHARSLTRVLAEQPDTWLFESLAPVFRNDDLTLGVLSMPLCEQDAHTADGGGASVASPDAVRFLTAGGVDALCLADDQAAGFGASGYLRTQEVLEAAGIPHCGTIETRQGDPFDELLVWKVKDVRIGIVGYSHPQVYQTSEILERVRLLRDNGCSLVIVSLDWSGADSTIVSGEQVDMARALIDGGADVIWGHGANDLLPVYWYAGKPVIMSAGTLCDGYFGAVSTFGACFTLTYGIGGGSPVLREVCATPYKTGGRGDYRPLLLEVDKNRQHVFSKLIALKDRGDLLALPRAFAQSGILAVGPDGAIVPAE